MWLGSGVAVSVDRLAAADMVLPLAWKLPSAAGAALKKKKKKKSLSMVVALLLLPGSVVCVL